MKRQKIRLSESQLKNIVMESVKRALNESYSPSLKVVDEIDDLSEFSFWGPAVQNVEELTSDELNQALYTLIDCYPEGLTSTQLNDIFAYDWDWVCEISGHKENDEEDEEEDNF